MLWHTHSKGKSKLDHIMKMSLNKIVKSLDKNNLGVYERRPTPSDQYTKIFTADPAFPIVPYI